MFVLGLAGGDLLGGWEPAGEVGTGVPTGVGLPAWLPAGVCPGAGGKGIVGVGTSATWLLGDCGLGDANGAAGTGLFDAGVGGDLGEAGAVLDGVCVTGGDPDRLGLVGDAGLL